MNRLPTFKRVQILSMLVEGMSMRSVTRLTGVSINTVSKLLADAGAACGAHHDSAVRNVESTRIQVDEVWAFCYAKEKTVPRAKTPPPEAGDVWTWVAIDPDTKLIVAYEIGDRTAETGILFLQDLRERLAHRVQLTSDGHSAYLEAVDRSFGVDVDFAQLVKIYGSRPGGNGWGYTGSERTKIYGEPDEGAITTSHIERQNLNMRMGMRRYTRKTNAHSKRIAAHRAMVNLYTCHYNFVRLHTTTKITPAMAAGIDGSLRDMEWIVGLVDARAPKPRRPEHYRIKEK